MGIALSTLSTLPAPLRTLTRWLQQAIRLQTTGFPRRNASVPTSCADPLAGPTTSYRHETSSEATASTNQRSAAPAGHRPLRENWPFKAHSLASAADARTRLQKSAPGSFLPASSPPCHSGTFFETLPIERHTHQPARVFRRGSEVGAGRLVIAGRMADVCAELDRMAASEGLRTQQVGAESGLPKPGAFAFGCTLRAN